MTSDTRIDPLVPRVIDRPTAIIWPTSDSADDAVEVLDGAKIFAAPDDPADWPAWRAALDAWRDDAHRRHDGDGAAYDDDRTAWASTSFSVALTWLWDERLFDHAAQRFTPERFVAEAEAFGGFDGVVLWQAYPIVGIDERDQFDLYLDVPGIADLVGWFQARGIRVFVDYNPWDASHDAETTDDSVGESSDTVDADFAAMSGVGGPGHVAAMVELVTTLGVDGVFLDTMMQGDANLVAALRQLDPPQVLEGESKVSLARIADHQISWAQWFADSAAPGVLRAHWFERRHLQHHTRRWNRDHSAELQSAWMNGIGIVVWDAVFGSWVGWNARDRSTLRSMLAVQRAISPVFVDGDWTPLVNGDPAAIAVGVFTSRWQLDDVTLWTIVNRGSSAFRGQVLETSAEDGSVDGRAGGAWFDVTTGCELAGGGADATVPARGVAGIVHVAGDVPAAIADLVAEAAGDAHDADATFPARVAERIAPPSSTGTAAPDAIRLTAGPTTLTVTSRLRETGLYDGAPFVEEWKPLPPRLHADVTSVFDVHLGAVAVAAREVTAAEFAAFVGATAPVGPDDPDGAAVGVSLAQARAYARWAGARLPTEFEWQAAGARAGFARRTPAVWNWTESEHSDGVTRFVILKGGATYRASASEWYFDGGERDPSFSAKFLLPGLGLDRSTSIGFRLAWDLP